MTAVAGRELGQARALVRCCVNPPSMADLLADSDNLTYAGVSSLEIMQIIVRLEGLLGRQLSHQEVSRLDSITSLAALLHAGAVAEGGS
ncbi:phosphopantetheine-binding protein [Streptomyces sp. NPDC006450]|uniref:phosphopantetheine-binding protein n=1 Tax=Streptomyces sp. NPDC006450 TaxID=3155458 RepID=UPI00339E3D79